MPDTSTSQFADSGILTCTPNGTKVTRYQVLGERSSGTNFTKRLLGRNTNLKPTEALGWKHGFPHATAIPPDLLVIGMVRSADAWALSMHAKPWHCSPELQSLEFPEFIRAEWDTYIDRSRYFEGSERQGTVGQPLQHDRHPLTGKRFANLFALRQAKLTALLSYLDRGCNFALIRMEETTSAPETALTHLCAEFDIERNDSQFKPVMKRLGAKFKAAVDGRPSTPKRMDADCLAYLKSQVHGAQEKALGYSY